MFLYCFYFHLSSLCTHKKAYTMRPPSEKNILNMWMSMKWPVVLFSIAPDWSGVTGRLQAIPSTYRNDSQKIYIMMGVI